MPCKRRIDLMKRARRAGYNGIFVADSKFDKFQLQDKSYARNCPHAPPGLDRARR